MFAGPEMVLESRAKNLAAKDGQTCFVCAPLEIPATEFGAECVTLCDPKDLRAVMPRRRGVIQGRGTSKMSRKRHVLPGSRGRPRRQLLVTSSPHSLHWFRVPLGPGRRMLEFSDSLTLSTLVGPEPLRVSCLSEPRPPLTQCPRAVASCWSAPRTPCRVPRAALRAGRTAAALWTAPVSPAAACESSRPAVVPLLCALPDDHPP